MTHRSSRPKNEAVLEEAGDSVTLTGVRPAPSLVVNQPSMLENLVNHLGPQFARTQFVTDCSVLNGRLPTKVELQSVLNNLSSNPDLGSSWIANGCDARARWICGELRRRGLNCSKLFVTSLEKRPLQASNQYMKAEWAFHVAPLVWAQGQGTAREEAFILDPSVSNRLLTPEKWVDSFRPEPDLRIGLDLTSDRQISLISAGGVSLEPEDYMLHPLVFKYARALEQGLQQFALEHGRQLQENEIQELVRSVVQPAPPPPTIIPTV